MPPPGISNVACVGNESRIAECSSVMVNPDVCETSSVVCQGILSFMKEFIFMIAL